MNESRHDSTRPPDNDPLASVASLNRLIGRPGPPPLRIHHIIAATTVSAVLLSVNQLLRQHDTFHLSTLFGTAWGASYTIATAISATVVGFGYWWWRRGMAFFDLPGHWLLVEQSLGIGLFVAIGISQLIYLSIGDEFASIPIAICFLLVNLSLVAIGIWAAWKIADSLSWRLLFLLHTFQIVAVYALAFFAPRPQLLTQWIPYIAFFVLVSAAVGDRFARRQRDWPHWLGIFLHFGVYLAIIGQQIWNVLAAHLSLG